MAAIINSVYLCVREALSTSHGLRDILARDIGGNIPRCIFLAPQLVPSSPTKRVRDIWTSDGILLGIDHKSSRLGHPLPLTAASGYAPPALVLQCVLSVVVTWIDISVSHGP